MNDQRFSATLVPPATLAFLLALALSGQVEAASGVGPVGPDGPAVSAAANTIYVDAGASGVGDGSS